MALNVLVVDDCDLVRTMMARTLALSNVPVGELYQAANGREALGIIQSEWIDLILADLNMPVMDGIRMIEQLHEEGITKTVPVVVVSTEGSTTRIDGLKAKGVTAYVRKPFTPEGIRDVVRQVVGSPDGGDHRQPLVQALQETAERFALMLAELPDREAPWLDPDGWVQAKLAFRGPFAGNLAVAAPSSLAREIAANVLGTDKSDMQAAKSAAQAIKEFANLACGMLLSNLAGPEAVFDLSAPVLTQIVRSDWSSDESCCLVGLDLEGSPMMARLAVRSWD
jgi:two-component system chemotaxis response regulator CheY